MRGDSRLYATQEQQEQQRHQNQNDPDSQIRRRIFYHRRPNKYLTLLLILLAAHAVYNVEDSNDMRRILWYNDHGHVNARRRDNEVIFEPIHIPSPKHISKATVTLYGVYYNMPSDASTLFEEVLYNALIIKDYFTKINDVYIDQMLSLETTRDVDGDDDDGEDGDDDDGEDGDDDDDNNQEMGPRLVSNQLQASDYVQQSPIPEIVWGHRNKKKRKLGSGILRLEVTISYHFTTSLSLNGESFLRMAFTEESSNIVRNLKHENYYQNLRRLEFPDIIDARPDIEDINDAQDFFIPSTPIPTLEPSPGTASLVQVNHTIPDTTPSSVRNEDPRPVPNVSSKRPAAVRSKAERYRNASACVFVVTLIIIGFWNMVRLNRKQIERRRRKVALAKIAYQAPLSMTNGLMDMGVPGRFNVPTQNYDLSAFDEDNYLGTMDKNTTAPP